MVLIGGRETVAGPMIGAVVLLLAEDALQRLTQHWLVGIGLMIIAIVMGAPQGLVPLMARMFFAGTAADSRWQWWRHG